MRRHAGLLAARMHVRLRPVVGLALSGVVWMNREYAFELGASGIRFGAGVILYPPRLFAHAPCERGTGSAWVRCARRCEMRMNRPFT